jgi:hypothetical protein
VPDTISPILFNFKTKKKQMAWKKKSLGMMFCGYWSPACNNETSRKGNIKIYVPLVDRCIDLRFKRVEIFLLRQVLSFSLETFQLKHHRVF